MEKIFDPTCCLQVAVPHDMFFTMLNALPPEKAEEVRQNSDPILGYAAWTQANLSTQIDLWEEENETKLSAETRDKITRAVCLYMIQHYHTFDHAEQKAYDCLAGMVESSALMFK